MTLVARRRPAALLLGFAVALAGLLASCADQPGVIRLAGETMGTQYRVTAIPGGAASDRLDAGAIEAGLLARLTALNNSFSTYIPNSELSRFNRSAAPHCQLVSADLARVFTLSRQVHERSGGAFNPALAALIARWGFDSEARDSSWEPPADEELAALLAASDLAGFSLGEDNTLCKQQPSSLNFSAVAKGYAVDALAGVLADMGIERYLVDIGGELRANGSNPDGRAWQLAVEQPLLARGQVLEVLALAAGGVATSGDYRNFFEHNGRTYGHTLDPRSGQPVTHGLRSVTVVSDTAAQADAWATALMVLGPEQGAAVARAQGLAVLLVEDDTGSGSGYRRQYSPAMEALLAQGRSDD